MSNPNSGHTFPSPDTYNGDFWNNSPDAHFRSGVINKWFYILSDGESGTNDLNNSYAVTGIGITNASQIAYLTEQLLNSSADYAMARTMSIQAVNQLFGAGSCEAVSVTNAWYAVGVGNQFSGSAGTYPISGADNLCTTVQYSVSNLPPNSSVAWSSSNNSIATISSTGLATQVGTGTVVFTASITFPCGAGSRTETKSVRVGSYTISDYTLTANSSTNQPLYWCPNSNYSFHLSGAPATNWSWSYPSGWTVNYNGNTNYIALKAPPSSSPPTGSITVAFNEQACGAALTKSFFAAYSSSACTGTDPRFTYSPNPAPSYIYVAVASGYTSSTFIYRIQFVRISTGMTVFDQNYGGVSNAYVTTSGLQTGNYYLRIWDGSSWATYQFVR